MNPERIKKYLARSEDVLAIGQDHQSEAYNAVMAAIAVRIEELRKKAELHPERSDNLQVDIVGILGEIRGLRWIQMLIDDCKAYLHELSSPSDGSEEWPE